MKKLLSLIIAAMLVLSMCGIIATAQPVFYNQISTGSDADPSYTIAGPDEKDPSKIPGQVHGFMGDADNDSEVSIMDATEIQLGVARLISMSEIISLLADGDGDGEVSIMDATEIQLYVAQLPTYGVIGRILYTPDPTEPETQPTEPPTEAMTPEKGARLTVWAPDAAVDVFRNQCYDFIDKYPGYNINIRVEAMGEGDAATSILNDPYYSADVFSFACDQLNRLDDADVILPVDKKLEADIKSRNLESSVTSATIDGQLLAYPQTADNGYILYYDKRYVSDEDAKTLEGVLKACRRSGKDFIMDAGNGFYACMFPFTGGLRIEGLEGYYNDTQKFNDYNEAEVVATMKAFATLFHDYDDVFTSTGTYKIPSGFASSPSTVAAGIDGGWDAATIKQILGNNMGAAKLPTIDVNGENKQLVSMHGFKLLGVNACTMYPNASQLLADYLSGEACQKERAQEISWGPSNKNVISTDMVQSNPTIKALLDQANYSVPQINISPSFWDPMGTLGYRLADPYARYDTTTITNLLRTTIANIRDY